MAVDLASRHAAAKDRLSHIRDAVIDRTNALCSTEGEQRLAALDDAIALLQTVYNKKWDNHEAVVKNALASALLHRAVHLSSEYNKETEARLDASHAHVLTPKSLRAIIVLCQISLFDAAQLYTNRKFLQAEALMEQVGKELEKGEALFPGHSDLVAVRNDLETALDIIMHKDETVLPKPTENWHLLPDDTTDHYERDKMAEGIIRIAQNDFAGAIEIFSEILNANPAKPQEVESRMVFCYRDWADYERDMDGKLTEEGRRIAKEALERFPRAEALAHLARELDEFEDM
jgi:tetratricopeptide (TPR) repeat protein